MTTIANIADHMALTCHCGSVRFCLLRSGGIECAGCQNRPAFSWRENDADTSECKACCGKGFNDVWRKVTGHYNGGEVFREECEACEGKGRV